MVRFPVSCSKVRGVMNSVAWAVMMTSTQQCCFTSAEASAAALYAAMPPVTPRRTVFPCSMI